MILDRDVPMERLYRDRGCAIGVIETFQWNVSTGIMDDDGLISFQRGRSEIGFAV